MPRGKPKTREDLLKEARMEREWRSRQPPLKSPCLEGRRRHYFGQFNRDPDMRCSWCGKTRRQVKAEQKMKNSREAARVGSSHPLFPIECEHSLAMLPTLQPLKRRRRQQHEQAL